MFRSHRPNSRRCYGASLTHSGLGAQAKGCYASNGQRELRANFTHSAVPMLAHLGIPNKWSLRLLLRPGPPRWGLGVGLLVGSWVMDLNMALRLEMPGVYGGHGLLVYGTRGTARKAEITGRLRFEHWCDIWADVGITLNSVSSTVLVSARCKGVGRLVWLHYGGNEGGEQQKTSLTIQGQKGANGLKGSLGLENGFDSLQLIISALLKGQRADFGCTLQHHWASMASTIPNRLALQGSGQLSDASLSGSALLSVSTRLAQVNITANWEPFTTLRMALQQNLAPFGAPEELTVHLATTASQAELQVDSDMCDLHILATHQRTRADRTTTWNLVAHQQCVLLKVRWETSTRNFVSQQKESKRSIFTYLEIPFVFLLIFRLFMLFHDQRRRICDSGFPFLISHSLSCRRSLRPTSPSIAPAAPHASALFSRLRGNRKESSIYAPPVSQASTLKLLYSTP